MQYAEPCQLLHAAAALLEDVAAYPLWLQYQQDWLRSGCKVLHSSSQVLHSGSS